MAEVTLGGDGHVVDDARALRDASATVALRRCLEAQAGARPRGAAARMFGLSPLHPDARDDYRRTLLELRVAEIVGRLRPTWTVLPAVGHGVDHLLVSRAGVFAVHTDSESDAVLAAEAVSRALSAVAGHDVTVTPLIVGRAVPPSIIAPAVAVVPAERLAITLLQQPRMLTEEQASALGSAASAWAGTPTGDSAPVARFLALRAEVDAARHRALLWRVWGAAALTVLVAAAVVVVFGVLLQP